MTSLSDYLVALAGRHWQWGRSDCLLVLADWIALRRGVDPGAPWRGAYATEAQCQALLAREGGLRRLLTGALASHGLSRTTSPLPGDVGLVAPVDVLVGGICSEPGTWAVFTGRGVVMAPMRCVWAWAV